MRPAQVIALCYARDRMTFSRSGPAPQQSRDRQADSGAHSEPEPDHVAIGLKLANAMWWCVNQPKVTK